MSSEPLIQPELAVHRSSLRLGLVISTALLCAVGVWLSFRHDAPESVSPWWYAVGLVALLPGVAKRLQKWSRSLRYAPRGLVTVAVACATLAYLVFESHIEHRDLQPKIQDEFMFLLQARMLTHGRLWMHQHPLANAMQTFHVLVQPHYAAAYFPGTALPYAAALLLHVRTWLVAVIIMSGVVAMTYRVINELTDGVMGMLAAAMVLACGWTRLMDTLVLSYPLMLLLSLLMVWAWLRWRRRHHAGWLVFIGVLMGWSAITRPLDAICFAAPLLVAIGWELIRHQTGRRAVIGVSLIALGALPFISLQLIFDRGVGGHWLQTPEQQFNSIYWPNNVVGLRSASVQRPPSTSPPEFQEYFDRIYRPALVSYRDMPLRKQAINRMVGYLDVPLLLLPILPLVLMGLPMLWKRWRWPFACGLPLLFLGYLLFYVELGQYLWMVVAVLAMAVVLGAQRFGLAMAQVLPIAAGRSRHTPWITAAMLGLSCVTARALIVMPPPFYEALEKAPLLRDVDSQLQHLKHLPAVVLFRYTPGDDFQQEPVYNIDAPWPDDEPIVRLQDLGTIADQKIFEYYAANQPTRCVYRYDRHTWSLQELGFVTELAKKSGDVNESVSIQR